MKPALNYDQYLRTEAERALDRTILAISISTVLIIAFAAVFMDMPVGWILATIGLVASFIGGLLWLKRQERLAMARPTKRQRRARDA